MSIIIQRTWKEKACQWVIITGVAAALAFLTLAIRYDLGYYG